jgi:hypothetical protein
MGFVDFEMTDESARSLLFAHFAEHDGAVDAAETE